MNTNRLAERQLQIQNWMWSQRLQRAHSPSAGMFGDPRRLHFLFGVSGSGADHLGQLLARADELNYCRKPLAGFEPKLVLSRSEDPLAQEYSDELPKGHPLLRVYRMLVENGDSWMPPQIQRPGSGIRPAQVPYLVFETNALLATEAILRAFECRALLYIGDPVRTLDRLFKDEGIHTPYLRSAGRNLLEPDFIRRIMRQMAKPVMSTYLTVKKLGNARQRQILYRVLNIALVQHMFRILAVRYPRQVMLVRQDLLQNDPTLLPPLLTHLFGDNGMRMAHTVLADSTLRLEHTDKLIWKHSWPQSLPWSGILGQREIRSCYQVLEDSGLTTGRPAGH